MTVDSSSHLTHITYADGADYGFEYTSDGLLTVKTEPSGNRFEHRFDPAGRLEKATEEEEGSWSHSKTAHSNGDIRTESLTTEGSLTTDLDHTYSTGAYTSCITDPTGAETIFTQSADGQSSTKFLSRGKTLAFEYGIDPLYYYRFLERMTEATPSGLTRITVWNQTYIDTNGDGVPIRSVKKSALTARHQPLLPTP